MRALGVCAAVVTSLIVLFAVGCGGDAVADSEAAAQIRAELESIHQFVTENEGYDVGHTFTADGQGSAKMVTGPLALYFRDGEIHYQVSDYWDQCTYEVDGKGHIEAALYSGAQLEGRYHGDSGRLKWDGRWYVAE